MTEKWQVIKRFNAPSNRSVWFVMAPDANRWRRAFAYNSWDEALNKALTTPLSVGYL